MKEIFFNVVGGVLVSILTYFWLKVQDKFSAYSFKKIFGPDAEGSSYIVYGLTELAPAYEKNGQALEWPYFKPDLPQSKFRFSSPVSAAQMRAAKYIAESFGKNIKSSPKLVPDNDIKQKLDISFCSVGGINNLKTLDILEADENNFFDFDWTGQGVISVINEPGTNFGNDGFFDHGFIIKLVPKSFENRVWIAVAGLGEWGTSGAAWYLARNWKEIQKKYGSNPFGLIVKVRGGKDESAKLVYESK